MSGTGGWRTGISRGRLKWSSKDWTNEKRKEVDAQVSYYYTCPDCGANLDPGEKCSDCAQTPARYHVRVEFHDGDSIDTTITATPTEIVEKYPLGEMVNVGAGSFDLYKRITGVEMREIKERSA